MVLLMTVLDGKYKYKHLTFLYSEFCTSAFPICCFWKSFNFLKQIPHKKSN